MNTPTPADSLFDRRSIRFPLIRIIVVVIALGVCLTLASQAILAFESLRNDVRRTLTSAANAAGIAASAAVVFHDAKAARDVLQMFDAYPEIRAVAVYPNEGYRLASYGDGKLLPADAGALAVPPMLEVEPLANMASVHLPIMVDGYSVGSIYLQAKLDTYLHAYLAAVATTFVVALLAGAVALFLAMRFVDGIILPVRLLAKAARYARLEHDFRPREIPAEDNEIGDMVRNFNSLLAEVDNHRNSLRAYQADLERLVAERTAELSAAKEAAEHANAAKSHFLAAASHDLRQPIQAMSLFQDALRRTPQSEEQCRITDYLIRSTQSLAKILNALLDVSRFDAGTVKPLPEIVSTHELFRTIEAEFALLALAKGLRFKLFFPVRDLLLFTDAQLLQALVRNLIDNAIKYTETGGILVGVRRRHDSALIQVWDTGIGISPEHLERIFDEYFQVSNPQRDSTKGLGLGLAIARRAAGVIGGWIRCRSRPTKGSVFEISVPLAQDREPAPDYSPGPSAGETAPRRLDGAHVVVVDDDAMAATAVELALASCGIGVKTYHSAESALADAGIGDADLYIADFRLPGLNGIQFFDALQERTSRPVNALLLTGESFDAAADSPLSSGWKVLRKPVDLATLVAEIGARVPPAAKVQIADTADSVASPGPAIDPG
jgi:signal transduction histidine kinase/ActR/RegA family two-component response regulator